MNTTFCAIFVQVFGSSQIQFVVVCSFGINIIDVVDWDRH